MNSGEFTYENLDETGYKVIKKVLPDCQLSILRDSIVKNVIDLVFTRQGFKVSYKDPTVLRMLTDMNLRKKKLGEKGKDIVWRNGNSRQPLVSKNCGMAGFHFDETVLDLVTLNQDIYDEVSKVTGTKYLVHSNGPERVCLKAPGSVDMPKHIDSNLFDDSLNYDLRIQSLITVEIESDSLQKIRDTGTLCLLTYFHHYWDFARELFHPLRGLFPMKKETMKSRFFILPSSKKDDDDFNKDYLPRLKKYAKIYADILEDKNLFPLLKEGKLKDERFPLYNNEQLFFFKIIEKGIKIPSNKTKYIEKMDWECIYLQPGDMVLWHQYLPHFSVRNRTNTPRIAVYYSLLPVKKGWFGTNHQKWVARQFQRCEFYYGINHGNYPTNPVNIEELAMIKEKCNLKKIADMCSSSEFTRKITGQESWWDEENFSVPEPKDVGKLCEAILSHIEKNGNSLEKYEAEKLDSTEENTPYKIPVYFKKYWSFIPKLIPNSEDIFKRLLPQLYEVCKCLTFNMYGKEILLPRVSVLYTDNIDTGTNKVPGGYYENTPTFLWEEAPVEISEIRSIIEEFTGIRTDYVLCHIYRGIPEEKKPGGDHIGWHNDAEALNSSVISVSLGAKRKFQFCKIDQKGKVCDELCLKSGDVLHMHGPRGKTDGCQKVLKHRVPPMSIKELIDHIEYHGITFPKGRKTYKIAEEIIRKNNIPPDRINLTFRQYED